jgi:SAM-dependent methyltransferase
MVEGLPEPDPSLHDFRGGLGGEALGRRRVQVALLERYGLQSSSSVMEIGCGVGWLAYDLASRLDADGAYAGCDVSDVTIRWLDENFVPRLPNFRFDFLDVQNPRYRPRGKRKSHRARLPYPDRAFDIACAFNVFMHVDERGIEQYLREIARVVRADGVGLVTLKAIFDGDVGPTEGKRAYVPIRPGVYTRRPERHGWSMAYDDSLIRAMIDRSGLHLHACENGAWHTTRPSDAIQPGADLYVVMPKPPGA